MQKCRIIVNHERYSGVLKTRYFARSSKWLGDSAGSSVLIKVRRVRFRDRYGKQIDIQSRRVQTRLRGRLDQPACLRSARCCDRETKTAFSDMPRVN